MEAEGDCGCAEKGSLPFDSADEVCGAEGCARVERVGVTGACVPKADAIDVDPKACLDSKLAHDAGRESEAGDAAQEAGAEAGAGRGFGRAGHGDRGLGNVPLTNNASTALRAALDAPHTSSFGGWRPASSPPSNRPHSDLP